MLSWFIYDPLHPLLFSTGLFLSLFIVFYLVYIFTKNHSHFRTIYVLLFSLFFYYKVGGFYFILLLLLAFLNYVLSEVMDLSEKHSMRKRILVLIICMNLATLIYFNYTNFFINGINQLLHHNFPLQNIILPIGLSFFVFQSISYSVDLYKKQISPIRNVLDFSFYLCFFPKLVSGPIVRAQEFIPQMYSKISLSRRDAGLALFLIITGLIKKSVISDYISQNFVNRVFDSPLSYSSFETLIAVYGYALQIYTDFSGYSDMAIALSLLMGFKLSDNFNFPYQSQSITEFWKRWHISLSRWLRDYLYIPLGGNRKGRLRTYLNLMLTMLIGGFWHGAALKYIVWGGLHGSALVIERFCKQYFKIPHVKGIHFVRVFLTFHFVAFCWIFFRASDFNIVIDVLSNIFKLRFNVEEWGMVLHVYQNVFILLLIGFVISFLPISLIKQVEQLFLKLPFFLKGVLVGFVFWLVFATASSDAQPFIYLQF